MAPVYSRMVDALSVLSLDFLDLMPFDCTLSLNHDHYLLLRTLVPLAVLAASLAYRRIGRSEKGAEKLLTLNFILFYLLFPSNSANIFATFHCEELDDPDATTFLRIDYYVDCKAPFHVYVTYFAAAMVLVYPVGIPAFYAYLLFVRHGPQLKLLRGLELQRQALRKEALLASSLRGLVDGAEGDAKPRIAVMQERVPVIVKTTSTTTRPARDARQVLPSRPSGAVTRPSDVGVPAATLAQLDVLEAEEMLRSKVFRPCALLSMFAVDSASAFTGFRYR